MTAVAAQSIGCREEQLLVCSTGVIGRLLPMPVIDQGIVAAAQHLEALLQPQFAASISFRPVMRPSV